MIMAIEARIRKNLNREGTRNQRVRIRIIATVSRIRTAVVIGKYMPLVG